MELVERWGVFETAVEGRSVGNPFADCEIWGEFCSEKETKLVRGFYDGDGIYRVRFMPSYEGVYRYRITGTYACEGQTHEEGSFLSVAPSEENHGPVRVTEKTYLQYEDGTPYYSLGTTCYAWVNQSRDIYDQTVQTLAHSSFNKLRFCLFPKYYLYNQKEPEIYPFARGVRRGQDAERLSRFFTMPFHSDEPVENVTDFDLTVPNPAYFRKFDQAIEQLQELGIEADLILFHPYDKWGFANMTRECDIQYLSYVIARYSAYRNVWWSLCNEYDLTTKTVGEWDELGGICRREDPYGHLRSIHNCGPFYDYHKDWITHCSMQRIDLYRHVEDTDRYLKEYEKPVVWDEIAYEGNINYGWGNITGEEMVRRFWEASLRGGYPGHGETFLHPDNILWWSHGGVLHGESEPRIGFLQSILSETPGGYLRYERSFFDEVVAVPLHQAPKSDSPLAPLTEYGDYEIHYFGFGRPGYREFELPADARYQIEVLDTWNMTVTDAGIHSGYTRIALPSRQYMAVRLQRLG